MCVCVASSLSLTSTTYPFRLHDAQAAVRGGKPLVRSEGNLETTAKTDTVQRRDDWNVQLSPEITDCLSQRVGSVVRKKVGFLQCDEASCSSTLNFTYLPSSRWSSVSIAALGPF